MVVRNFIVHCRLVIMIGRIGRCSRKFQGGALVIMGDSSAIIMEGEIDSTP